MIEGLELRRLLAAYVTDVGFAHGGAFDPTPDYDTFTQFTAVRDGRVTLVQGFGRGPDGTAPYDYTVERFHGDATPDRTFTPIDVAAPSDTVDAYFAQDSNGRIYVAQGDTLTRYTARGKIDRGFGKNGHADISAALNMPAALGQIEVADDGVIFVTFTRQLNATHTETRLTRLAENGVVDTGYGDGGSVKLAKGDPYLQLAVGPAGRAYYATAGSSMTFTQVIALAPSGAPDTKFGPRGVITPPGAPADLAVDSAGRLLVLATGSATASITRYTARGKPDATFGTAGTADLPAPSGYAPDAVAQYSRVETLLPQTDGTVYAEANERIYRLTDAGQPDTTFDTDGHAEMPENGRIAAPFADGFLVYGGDGVVKIAAAPEASRDADGTLRIYGDDGDDSVVVRLDRKNIRVSVNGRVTRVPLKGTHEAQVNLFGGNNTVSYILDVPATLVGAGGDDSIFARGASVDVQPGGGDNSIAFGAGGGGVDVSDFSTAAIGHDTINGNGGVLNVSVQNGSSVNVNFTGQSAVIYADSEVIANHTQANSSVVLNVTGKSSVTTGDGDDRIEASASTGNIFVDPGTGRDSVVTGRGDDTLYSVPDTVPARDGDAVNLGPGNDTAHDTDGNNTIAGGLGNDSIVTGDGNDSLSGGGGNDTLRGGNGQDALDGGDGRDRLYGGSDADSLIGGASNDILFGGTGADTLNGNGGDDILYAGDAFSHLPAVHNHIDGGTGNDTLHKESDADQFTNIESVLE